MTSPSSGLRARKKEATRAAIARASLELFAARGFAAVTLAEIAAAADVGERTIFRYFPDKEELLFGDDAAVREHLTEALAARPASEAPVVAVVEAMVALAPLWQDAQDEGRLRRAVIGAAPALAARQRAKYADYEHTVAQALVARGSDGTQARLLARAAVACADEAITRWFDDARPDEPGLAARIRATVTDLARQLRLIDDPV